MEEILAIIEKGRNERLIFLFIVAIIIALIVSVVMNYLFDNENSFRFILEISIFLGLLIFGIVLAIKQPNAISDTRVDKIAAIVNNNNNNYEINYEDNYFIITDNETNEKTSFVNNNYSVLDNKIIKK